MTIYRNCDLTHLPLHNRECAIFLIDKQDKPRLIGAPIFSIYDENEGLFDISDEYLQSSHFILKNCIEKNDPKFAYSITTHSNLKKGDYKNQRFESFVVLKEVFDNVIKQENYSDYIRIELLEALSQSILLHINMFKMIKMLQATENFDMSEYVKNQPNALIYTNERIVNALNKGIDFTDSEPDSDFPNDLLFERI